MDRIGAGHQIESPVLRWIIDMNFLHYAIFMFIVCSAVLIGVSLVTPAPDRKKLAGLTFATVNDKMDFTPVVTDHKPAGETAFEHRINVVASLALLATVIGLWIHFA